MMRQRWEGGATKTKATLYPTKKIRKADHPHLKERYLEEQNASKLKLLTVHKLSVRDAVPLFLKSLWTADKRTVTMNKAQQSLVISRPVICKAHSPQNHLQSLAAKKAEQ